MDAKKIIVSGIAAGVAILVFSLSVSYAMQAIFSYDVLKLAGMRSINDPIMLLFFLHPFVLAFAMAIVYSYVAGGLKGNYIEKGKCFGLLMWLAYSVPSAFIVFSSMNYPIGFALSSLVGGMIYMLAGGIIIAKLQE